MAIYLVTVRETVVRVSTYQVNADNREEAQQRQAHTAGLMLGYREESVTPTETIQVGLVTETTYNPPPIPRKGTAKRQYVKD